MPVQYSNLHHHVQTIVEATPVLDMHTHLYPPAFSSLLLWGIDELLTYHYLIAEVLRVVDHSADDFYQFSKPQQAELIWDELFVKRTPISEACRGVVTCLNALGIDPHDRNLEDIRAWYRSRTVEEFMELVFTKANVSAAVMTNDPFDEVERGFWDSVGNNNQRLQAALRIDPLLLGWEHASEQMTKQGYTVSGTMNDSVYDECTRFLETWCTRLNPRYVAVSLPPSFAYPDDSHCTRMLDKCVLPFCREAGLPFALMIGVKRQVNPMLQLAGDGVGRTNLDCIENLCVKHPDNRFLTTLLSRENQHELCVIARKFSNLMPFGCWWFMNNPSIIDEMTRQRIELLGWSMIPQHSDARVLDQLLYKWPHSRKIIADVLCEKYQALVDTGWKLTKAEISRDVARLFSLNFEEFAPPFQK